HGSKDGLCLDGRRYFSLTNVRLEAGLDLSKRRFAGDRPGTPLKPRKTCEKADFTLPVRLATCTQSLRRLDDAAGTCTDFVYDARVGSVPLGRCRTCAVEHVNICLVGARCGNCRCRKRVENSDAGPIEVKPSPFPIVD